jgi:hypothetical protein
MMNAAVRSSAGARYQHRQNTRNDGWRLHGDQGSIVVTLDGESRILDTGQLNYLARDVVHGVVAIEDASVQVTIASHR